MRLPYCYAGVFLCFLIREYSKAGCARTGHARQQRAGLFEGGNSICDDRLEIECRWLEVVAGGGEIRDEFVQTIPSGRLSGIA